MLLSKLHIYKTLKLSNTFFQNASSKTVTNAKEKGNVVEKATGRTCLGVSVLAASRFQDQRLRFLLGLRKNDPGQNKWSLPGGSLLWNEPIQDGALRELREETGLSLQDVEFIWPIAFASQVITPHFHGLIATVPIKIKFASTNFIRAADDMNDAKWYTKHEIELLQKAEKTQGNLTELIEYTLEKLF